MKRLTQATRLNWVMVLSRAKEQTTWLPKDHNPKNSFIIDLKNKKKKRFARHNLRIAANMVRREKGDGKLKTKEGLQRNSSSLYHANFNNFTHMKQIGNLKVRMLL